MGFVAHAQTGTYSPAYYRTLELEAKSASYTKRVRAVLAYEVAHMKKLVVGSFSTSTKGGYSYSFTNTAQYAHLMRCNFTVLFKGTANQVLGQATGSTADIAPGAQIGSDQITVAGLPPVGTVAGDIIITTTTAE
jgi:hypothetical protein